MNMKLSSKFQKIILNRDPRYDGQFYFGVKTTKIYCRPICPARPKPENILLFRSQAEAEIQNYRPCKRCRPEIGPNSRYHLGTNNTISRALKYIDHAQNESLFSVESLSLKLGVSDRHLRRLFDEHLGASPIDIIQTQRLHLAKQMIENTKAPISEIAFSAGFNSIRRFNDAFKKRFQEAPSKLRMNQQIFSDNHTFEFFISVHAPYNWRSTLAFMKRHELLGIEIIQDNRYLRFLSGSKKPSYFVAEFLEKQSKIKIRFVNVELCEVKDLLIKIRRQFDVSHNPCFLPNPLNGIRSPGSFDFYESVISIIFNQLISNSAARNQLRLFIERIGRPIGEFKNRLIYEFPKPRDVLSNPLDGLGLTKLKINAIKEFTHFYIQNQDRFNQTGDLFQFKSELESLKGIGAWTSELILMKCFGFPDAFPKNDLIIKNKINKQDIDIKKWEGYRSYLTHFLWHEASLKDIKKRTMP